MADTGDSSWEDVASSATNLLARSYITDAALQSKHPNWPTGGTSAQIQQESGGNNNAVSPKNAQGIAQFEPDTFNAVKKQMGRPGMDIHNVQDQMDAHQYLMMQNLDRTGGDVNGALSLYNSGKANANNPETNNYISAFNKRTGGGQPVADNSGGWEDITPAPKAASDGWEDVAPAQPSVLRQVGNTLGEGASAIGQVAASMGTGAFGLAAGALHGGADLLRGQSYDQAHQDLLKEQQAVTYQPRTPQGQALNQAIGGAMDKYVTQPLEQGGRAVIGAIPFIGEDLEKQGYAKPAAEIGTSIFENLGLPGVLHEAGSAMLKGKGAPLDSAGKLAPAADDAVAPSAQMPSSMGPNEGPQRPPIQVSPAGVADTGLGNANEVAGLQAQQAGLDTARERALGLQQQGAGTLFPEEGTAGQASPYNPNREAAVSPIEPETMQGQGRLDFSDPVAEKMQQMRDTPAHQLDIFDDTPHVEESATAPEETPRSLNPDEFAQTLQELAAKDGTRFQMPEDMEGAYAKYMDTVRDEQGQLFDRPTVAKNFVEAALQDTITRQIQDHPTVQANAAKAAQAKANADTLGTASAQAAFEQARSLLQKSVDNIGNHFKDAAKPLAPWEKDGIVYMNTFGDLSTLMKSLGAVLKGIHGVVFKTLDRALRRYDNLDSTGKIIGQGVKDFVSRQANRDWSQTVNAKPIDMMKGIPGLRDAVTELNPHAQDSLSPEELKAQFNAAPDLTSSKVGNALRNNVLQGGLMISDFSQHPLVKYVTDNVAKAARSADKWTRENLLNPKTGLRPLMKALNTKEFTEMRTLMEAYEGVKEFSPSELKGRGFTDKQVAYYQRSLELQKESFTKFNATRASLGMPTLDPRIAHIASYFTGDFRMMIKDGEGRLVAVLGHNNRAALQVIANRFKEMHPDGENLQMGKPTLSKMQGGTDATFTGFMNVLDALSKTNADVGRIVDAYRDTQMANTNRLSQMANRGKFKSNAANTIGGAEGSKLWQSMEKNAQEGGEQQLKYLESVNKWSEQADALNKSQAMIDSPDVNAPIAKGVSQRYLDNQMHRNMGDLNKFTNSFVNGMADITGVGPTQMRSMANFTKTGLLNMFVGLGKFSHSLVTLMQPVLGIPGVNSVLKARGAELGKGQVLSVFKSLMDNKDILQSMATGKPISDPFVRAANEYAKANDTFNTSQFQMGSVNRPATKVGTGLHINVTVPESGTRAFTYMYYARMLKDADVEGTLSDKEIFGTAHNATQKVMGDYNKEAGAAMYGKMGFLGDLTKMLTTFKLNQVSQYATASKMFSQGKIAPMATMLATSLASSGLRGFIGYNLANGALGQLTTWATKNGLMNQPTNLDQIVLHMLHGANKGLADALNFGATSALGIDMTGSLSHADDIPDDPLGTLLPEGNPIAKMMGSTATVIQHPNAQNAKAALYDVLPNSMKGIMENQAYTNDKGQYFDPHTGNLVTTRSPTDQMKRNFSFRPLEESKMRLDANVAQGQNQQLGAVKQEIIKRALSDADSNNGTVPSIQQYEQDYIKAGGDPKELVNKLVEHNGLNKNLDIGQRQEGMATGNFTNAEKYQRAQGFK